MSLQQEQSGLTQEHFEQLHENYYDRLLTGVRRFSQNAAEAEDVVSAAMAAAWAKRDTFRGDASAYTWLYSIARNEARSRYRKPQAARCESIDDPAFVEPLTREGLLETLDRTECCRRLPQALRRIPAFYRRPLVEHFVRGRSVRQIARRARIPVGTVLRRIFTGKRLLREAWEAA